MFDLPLSSYGFVKELVLYKCKGLDSNISFFNIFYNICYLIQCNLCVETYDLIITERATSFLKGEIHGVSKLN